MVLSSRLGFSKSCYGLSCPSGNSESSSRARGRSCVIVSVGWCNLRQFRLYQMDQVIMQKLQFDDRESRDTLMHKIHKVQVGCLFQSSSPWHSLPHCLNFFALPKGMKITIHHIAATGVSGVVNNMSMMQVTLCWERFMTCLPEEVSYL